MTDRDEQIARLRDAHNLGVVRRTGTTMADLTPVVADEIIRGGRWAPAQSKPELPKYPHQPEDSPFRCDPVGLEPSLGYSIEDQPAVGEVFEIERAQQILNERSVADAHHSAMEHELSVASPDSSTAPVDAPSVSSSSDGGSSDAGAVSPSVEPMVRRI
jgi:hypothetical protein